MGYEEIFDRPLRLNLLNNRENQICKNLEALHLKIDKLAEKMGYEFYDQPGMKDQIRKTRDLTYKDHKEAMEKQ